MNASLSGVAGADTEQDAAQQLGWYHTKLFLYVLGICFVPAGLALGWFVLLWSGVNRPVLGSPKAHARSKYHLPVARCCTACAAVALRRAEALALGVRLRVSFLPFACGWVLALGGCGPTAMRIGAAELPAAAGPASSYLAMVPIGLFMIVLSLRPTDGVAIRIACGVFVGLLLVCTMLLYSLAHGLSKRTDGNLAWLAALCYVAMLAAVFIGASLIPVIRRLTVHTTSGQALPTLPSRHASHRLWLALRLLGLCSGVALGVVPYISYTRHANTVWKLGPAGSRTQKSSEVAAYEVAGYAAAGAVSLVLSIVATPSRRSRLLRVLAAFPEPSENRAAALIAELVRPLHQSLGLGPRSFVRFAASRFRALPIEAITVQDLAGPPSARLHAKSHLAKFGQVDAWVSHARQGACASPVSSRARAPPTPYPLAELSVPCLPSTPSPMSPPTQRARARGRCTVLTDDRSRDPAPNTC